MTKETPAEIAARIIAICDEIQQRQVNGNLDDAKDRSGFARIRRAAIKGIQLPAPVEPRCIKCGKTSGEHDNADHYFEPAASSFGGDAVIDVELR